MLDLVQISFCLIEPVCAPIHCITPGYRYYQLYPKNWHESMIMTSWTATWSGAENRSEISFSGRYFIREEILKERKNRNIGGKEAGAMEKYILPGILLLVLIFVVYAYNRLVGLRNMARTAWANIDTLLQKRFDLVPNLVATVKGYMEHEREVLEEVTRARTAWMEAQTVRENAGADRAAADALRNLFALAENYPALKANENFLLLQEELTGLENKIAYARQRYNRTVMILNTIIERFPTNFIARLFRFSPYDYFALEDERIREAPGVELQGGERR